MFSGTKRGIDAAGRIQAYEVLSLIVTTFEALKLSVTSTGGAVSFGRKPTTNGPQAPFVART